MDGRRIKIRLVTDLSNNSIVTAQFIYCDRPFQCLIAFSSYIGNKLAQQNYSTQAHSAINCQWQRQPQSHCKKKLRQKLDTNWTSAECTKSVFITWELHFSKRTMEHCRLSWYHQITRKNYNIDLSAQHTQLLIP